MSSVPTLPIINLTSSTDDLVTGFEPAIVNLENLERLRHQLEADFAIIPLRRRSSTSLAAPTDAQQVTPLAVAQPFLVPQRRIDMRPLPEPFVQPIAETSSAQPFNWRDYRLAIQMITLTLFAMLAAVIVSFDAGFKGPLGALINAIPGKDKAVHFLVFGGLVVPTSLALGMRSFALRNVLVPYGTLVMLLLCTCEECSQLLFESRTFDLADLAANYLGITFFTGLLLIGQQIYLNYRLVNSPATSR